MGISQIESHVFLSKCPKRQLPYEKSIIQQLVKRGRCVLEMGTYQKKQSTITCVFKVNSVLNV